MTTADLLPTLAVLALATWLHGVALRRFSDAERPLLWGAFWAHVGSAFVQLWLVLAVYGIGDVLMYHDVGLELTSAMRADFLNVAPEVLKILFQVDHHLSVFIPAEGSSTASMCALSAIVGLFTDDSLVAINVLFALVAYAGKLVLYVAMKRVFPPDHGRLLLIGVLLVPSSVFWSAGLVKEGIAIAGIGPYLLGFLDLLAGRRRAGLASLLAGALAVALVKPYILLVLVGASGVTLYWVRSVARGRVEFRPLPLLLGAATVVIGVLVVGRISPRFSIDRLAEETGRLQSAGSSLNAKGHSMYVIGNGSTSLVGQLVNAPLGLLTALYRPALPEVRNPQMLVSALETTTFLVASIAVVARQSARQLWERVVRYPILAFCLSFVLVLGVATGLTSANLGTLTRYRMPIVPFFSVVLISFWKAPATAAAPGLAPRAAPRSTPGRTSGA